MNELPTSTSKCFCQPRPAGLKKIADGSSATAANEASYQQWVDEGWVTPCGERVIDQAVLMAKLMEIRDNFELKAVGFDRNRAAELIAMCEDEGITVELVNQSMMVFSDPSKKFEQHILERTIRHNSNPCLNWQVANARVAVRDDLIKPMKEYLASTKRIDAIIGAIMALYVRMKSLLDAPEDITAGVWELPGNLRGLLGM
jgi:phage terminase large subunit-like protein